MSVNAWGLTRDRDICCWEAGPSMVSTLPVLSVIKSVFPRLLNHASLACMELRNCQWLYHSATGCGEQSALTMRGREEVQFTDNVIIWQCELRPYRYRRPVVSMFDLPG